MKSKAYWAYLTIAFALVAVLILAYSSDDPITSTDDDDPGGTPIGTAAEVIPAAALDRQFTDEPEAGRPPCDDGDCGSRDVSTFDLFSGRLGTNSALAEPDSAASVEDVLENGLRLAEASPVHVAFRGLAEQAGELVAVTRSRPGTSLRGPVEGRVGLDHPLGDGLLERVDELSEVHVFLLPL